MTDAFWFKRDLYNYAKAAVGGEPMFLAGIDWTDPDVYKRDSVSTFVDRLVREQDHHQDLLLALLVDVASMTDFPQLARVEDRETKIAVAREAVARLKEVVQPYEQALAEQQASREQIAAAQAERADRRATAQRLAEPRDRYMEILQMDPHPRGLALEPYFLLEAKWENAPADRAALDIFATKVNREAENTLGLFVAISGFERAAAEIHSGYHSPLILMDGADLYAVLDDRIDLRELLRRKRRHAAMTGNIFLTATEVLSGS